MCDHINEAVENSVVARHGGAVYFGVQCSSYSSLCYSLQLESELMKPRRVTIQMRTIELYFHVVLIITCKLLCRCQ